MRTKNLFTLALATIAFAACNNDDDAVNGGNSGKGELIEQIGVTFTSPTATYAMNGEQTGKGTENNIYRAYVFAHSTDHGIQPGNWTVKTAGDGNTALTGPVTLNFTNVTQGENVYVLANDPNLTLEAAKALAESGADSERKIREYILNVEKSYLNGLAHKEGEDPKGHYMMSGMVPIPTLPIVPSGGTVNVEVPLNRQMAKVHFKASVTNEPTDEAYGKVKLEDGSGIVVVRVVRKVSPFTQQPLSWYPPFDISNPDLFDWDHTTWNNVFKGDQKSAPGVGGAPFNDNVFQETAAEYCYTWAHLDNGMLTVKDNLLTAPTFYVTPNLSGDRNGVSVICTQATYKGAPIYNNGDANTLLKAAFSMYDDKKSFKDSSGNPTTDYEKIVWNNAAAGVTSTFFGNTYKNHMQDLKNATGLEEAAINTAASDITKLKDVTADNHLILSHNPSCKVFYRADIADYPNNATVSNYMTEANTYYDITGTIKSIGVTNIEDAITSNNISMDVTIRVQPWNYSVNNVNM